jgi:mono/diheme cytochrome c family protein
MRSVRLAVVAFLAVVGAAAILLGLLTIRGGFTARAKASRIERGMAEVLRDLATPRSAKSQRSPIVGTPDVLTRARRHFASECASCHGNDGKGGDLGKRLFPPVPNLREGTADLTEGEIFWIVENGIRWSGMPAFSEPDDPGEAQSHWEIVYFVRHLPDLTGGEIEEMKRFNPQPPRIDAETGGAPSVHEGHTHGAPAPAEPPKPAAPSRRQRRVR